MKSFRATALLLAVCLGVGLVAAGCSHKDEATATPVVQPGESMDDAIARVQNDTSKSPEEKVKEIDAIQHQFTGGKPTPHKHNKNPE